VAVEVAGPVVTADAMITSRRDQRDFWKVGPIPAANRESTGPCPSLINPFLYRPIPRIDPPSIACTPDRDLPGCPDNAAKNAVNARLSTADR